MTAKEAWNRLNALSESLGRFPTPEEYSSELKLSKESVLKVWKRWAEEGMLSNADGVYGFAEKKAEKSEEPEKKEVRTEPKRAFTVQSALWIFAAVVGATCTICSVHFTYAFNKMGMKPLWAFLLSFSVVAFMSGAFALRSNLKERAARFLCVFLWTVGFFYSAFTAVSGQYNEFRKYTAADRSDVSAEKIKSFKERKESADAIRKSLLHWREDERAYTENPDLKRENPGTWKTIQAGVAKLEEAERRMTELEDERLSAVETDVVSDETVYRWIKRTIGVSADGFQLCVMLFPSVFIDLCSGFCFYYVFRKKEN